MRGSGGGRSMISLASETTDMTLIVKEELMFCIYLSRDKIRTRFNISPLYFLYLLHKFFSIEKKKLFPCIPLK